jgi:hypothetical protein
MPYTPANQMELPPLAVDNKITYSFCSRCCVAFATLFLVFGDSDAGEDATVAFAALSL